MASDIFPNSTFIFFYYIYIISYTKTLYFCIYTLIRRIAHTTFLHFPSIKLDILNFVGISSSIWIESEHTSASILFTPFHAHHFFNIFTTSFYFCKISLYNIWVQAQYANYHVITYIYHSDLFWMTSFRFFCAVGRPHFYYNEKEFFCLPHRQKAFLNHATTASFFPCKKRRQNCRLYWMGKDLNLRSRSNRFTVCPLWPLGNPSLKHCLKWK